MNNTRIQQLHDTAQKAHKHIASLTPQKKNQLEENWDIEHAYYSSVLEGSKLDRKEFEDLAKQVN